MARPGSTITASFRSAESGEIVQIGVPVETGLSSLQARITQACHDAAVALGCDCWIQPDDVDGAVWFAFRSDPFRRRTYLKSFPSLHAAEMWVLHHDE